MIERQLREQLLALYPVLAEVQAEQLDRVLSGAVIYRYKAGQQMWVETEKIDHFPFIIRGHGRVYKLAPNGRELHLYSVGPGDPCVLASGSMVNGSTVNARAVCEVDYEMVTLPMSLFKELISKSEPFRDYVLSDLSEHLAQLTDMVTAILFQNLDQRIAASLVSKTSPIQITHQALADELGSVREIVSRILKNFADRGWIELQRGQIRVLNPRILTEFANNEESVT